MMYQLRNSLAGSIVSRTDYDGSVWYIPIDESNTDYQRYLAWLAEGNTALMVD